MLPVAFLEQLYATSRQWANKKQSPDDTNVLSILHSTPRQSDDRAVARSSWKKAQGWNGSRSRIDSMPPMTTAKVGVKWIYFNRRSL